MRSTATRAYPTRAILPTQTEDGSGNLVFTYTRLHESTNDTTEIFEYSSDLVTWTDATIPASSGTVGAAIVTITPGGTTDAVTVTLPTSGAPVLFARLKVTQP